MYTRLCHDVYRRWGKEKEDVLHVVPVRPADPLHVRVRPGGPDGAEGGVLGVDPGLVFKYQMKSKLKT